MVLREKPFEANWLCAGDHLELNGCAPGIPLELIGYAWGAPSDLIDCARDWLCLGWVCVAWLVCGGVAACLTGCWLADGHPASCKFAREPCSGVTAAQRKNFANSYISKLPIHRHRAAVTQKM